MYTFKKQWLSLITAGSTMIMSLSAWADDSDFHPPHIPSTAGTVAGFIPSGWRLFASSPADLDGDGLKDDVIVIAKGKKPDESDTGESHRGLIIVMKERNGKLKKALENWEVIMQAGAGGAGRGEAFQELKASKGKIVISQEGGDAGVWSCLYTFGMLNGVWTLIGATHGERSGQDNITSLDFDWDLLTGRAHYTWSRTNWDPDDADKKATPKDQDESFFVLSALRTNDPALSRPVVRLKGDSVTTGSWHGVKDLSAAVSAYAEGSLLTIHAEVTDDHVTARDTIKLVNDKGSVIPPRTNKIVRSSSGYIQECAYDLPKVFGDQDLSDDVFALASVEVWDYDGGNKVHCIMSTSDGGRSFPAEITLSASPLLVRLSDFKDVFPTSILFPMSQARTSSD